jgi:hypothetical protein
MAFTPTNQLKADATVFLRDQQHAARLFVDDQFRLAPKSKFLFHVAFNINPAALKNIDLAQRHKNEINMLVKSIDLPTFTVNTEVLNQYNRKKVMQYRHTPGEIGVKFHDDNMGVINQMWQNYYSYYYADPTSAGSAGAYNRTATRKSDFITTAYGLDNGSTAPFFNYIMIYQMARHEFVSYKIINPIITSWNHNKMDYAQLGTHDFDMKLQYEAVQYSTGIVGTDSVEGFGLEHYDQTPSPLSGTPDINSTSPTFTSSNNVTGNGLADLNAVTKQINTGILNNLITNSSQGVAGLQGIAFPQSAAASSTITATSIKLG